MFPSPVHLMAPGHEEEGIKGAPRFAARDQADDDERISLLPDDVLHAILLRMSYKEAAATAVLSKRWRGLFSSLPDLLLTSRDAPPGSFLGTLSSRGGSAIRSCALSVNLLDAGHERDYHRVTQLVCDGGVGELSILGSWRLREDFPAVPAHVFSCQTIRVLKLFMCRLTIPPEFAGLRRLRALELESVVMTDEQFSRMVTRCRSLERLNVRNCHRARSLTVVAGADAALSSFSVVTDRPLAISVEEAARLESVSVCFWYHKAERNSRASRGENGTSEAKRLSRLLKGLNRVQSLSLGFTQEYAEGLCVQRNTLSGCCMVSLKKLSLSMNYSEKSMAALLLCLLKSSPCLQDLAIRNYRKYVHLVDSDFWDDQPPWECVKNRLETVTLNLNCRFQGHLIGFPRFLLRNARHMRKMSIRCSPASSKGGGGGGGGDLSFQDFCGELLLLPRASPTVDVEIIRTCQ